MKLKSIAIVAAGVVAVAVPGLVLSQPGAPVDVTKAPPRPNPTNLPPFSMNPTDAPAGQYSLDARHVGIIVRVLHYNKSWSIFRMEKAAGTLQWDPTDLTKSKISVTVDPNSITSNVPNFAAELAGTRYLDHLKFPEIKLESTSIVRTSQTTGVINANMTVMGVTKPVAIEAAFMGVGKTVRGQNAVGYTGKFTFNRQDYGIVDSPGAIGDWIEVQVDGEFLADDNG